MPKCVSKEAKLAKQEGDECSDRQTDTRTRAKKSLPNNSQEDPILVVNHCVGISYSAVYDKTHNGYAIDLPEVRLAVNNPILDSGK